MDVEAVSPPKATIWREPIFWVLIALVVVIHFSRLTALPVAGEEGRWARGAVQMIETGDWIVPRQQGQVFPERPPMSSWAMALAAMLTGGVNDFSVRLPSALAVVLTAATIYWYARQFMGKLGSFAAASAFATTVHVLELGRMGESEALFTYFLSAAMLYWHVGYAKGWRPSHFWIAGYSFAALAALVKGPQAPIYFGAAAGLYLLTQRDWRTIFSKQHAVGIVSFVAIVALWQIPFYFMTDWAAVKATWAGLAGDRIRLNGLLHHIATFPLETLACLLPWSPLLLALCYRRTRQILRNSNGMALYAVVAVAATYPSLWFAAGARGRYFLPLYPLIALLIGMLIERTALSSEATLRRHWVRFTWFGATVCFGGGVVVLAATLMPNLDAHLKQPLWFAITFCILGIATGSMLLKSLRVSRVSGAYLAVVSFVVFIGIGHVGVVVNFKRALWNDAGPAVVAVRESLPHPERMVSFGPVDHRFAYHYEESITELPWPTSAAEVPSDVEYFFLNHFPTDTDKKRTIGRGRDWGHVTTPLPFEWESVGEVCCERKIKDKPQVVVLVCKITKRPSPVHEHLEYETDQHDQPTHVARQNEDVKNQQR